MEQVFKTKRARRWWIIIVSLVVLIIFLNVYLEQSWAFSALGGIIISVLMFYSQSKTIYIVKDTTAATVTRLLSVGVSWVDTPIFPANVDNLLIRIALPVAR